MSDQVNFKVLKEVWRMTIGQMKNFYNLQGNLFAMHLLFSAF